MVVRQKKPIPQVESVFTSIRPKQIKEKNVVKKQDKLKSPADTKTNKESPVKAVVQPNSKPTPQQDSSKKNPRISALERMRAKVY